MKVYVMGGEVRRSLYWYRGCGSCMAPVLKLRVTVAAEEGHEEVAKQLLRRYDAAASSAGNNGRTLQSCAAEYECKGAVKQPFEPQKCCCRCYAQY